MKLKIQIDLDRVQGEGKKLYALIRVDQDDAEDTMLDLWRADSEDHLYDQVLADFIRDDEDKDIVESMTYDFENEIWGLMWLPNYLGEIE